MIINHQPNIPDATARRLCPWPRAQQKQGAALNWTKKQLRSLLSSCHPPFTPSPHIHRKYTSWACSWRACTFVTPPPTTGRAPCVLSTHLTSLTASEKDLACWSQGDVLNKPVTDADGARSQCLYFAIKTLELTWLSFANSVENEFNSQEIHGGAR